MAFRRASASVNDRRPLARRAPDSPRPAAASPSGVNAPPGDALFPWKTIMNTPKLGLMCVKAVALAVSDRARAERFYGEALGLPPAMENGVQVGYLLGDTALMLKEDWYGKPTAEPNPRITVLCADARATEAELRRLDVRIADPVERYDGRYLVGSFLDSEGNKLWFCSAD